MLQLHSHKPPILHRDLKSPNLLVDKHWRVKIADFNLSRVMEAQSVVSSISANNPRYTAAWLVAYLPFLQLHRLLCCSTLPSNYVAPLLVAACSGNSSLMS